jgi:AraC-like DNA-binding protein
MTDLHRAALMQYLSEIIAGGPATRVVFALPGGTPPVGAAMIPGARLSFVTSGCKNIQAWNGSHVIDHHLQAGEAIVMPSYGWTVPFFNSARTIFGIIRHRDFTRFIWSRYDGTGPPTVPQFWFHTARPMSSGPAQALGALAELSSGDLPVAAQQLWVFLHFARKELQEATVASADRTRATWNRLCEHIHQHLENELGRDDLARRFNLHPSYVSFLFTKIGGESFGAYVTRLRLDRAIELLRGDLPIHEVARRCGFQDAGYFIKVFRKHFGSTPGRFPQSPNGVEKYGHSEIRLSRIPTGNN